MMELFINILFPKQCFGCSKFGNFFCALCQNFLNAQQYQRCIICQAPSLGGWTHPKCKTSSKPERLITFFDYHSQLFKKALTTAKYNHIPTVFDELTQIATTRLQNDNHLISNFVLCPVPMHPSKQRFRGFNQSQIICQVFAKSFTLAIDPILQKVKATREQKTLIKIQRQTNLNNSITILQPDSLPTKVLLIDDVTTTGSTFLASTKILKSAGVKEVWCIALAQD